jgi:hypothetical protein
MTLKFVRNQWIGSPEDFRVLLRPRAGNEIGGVEAGISRRDCLDSFMSYGHRSGQDSRISAPEYIRLLLWLVLRA